MQTTIQNFLEIWLHIFGEEMWRNAQT